MYVTGHLKDSGTRVTDDADAFFYNAADLLGF